jgi:hypothetical protein
MPHSFNSGGYHMLFLLTKSMKERSCLLKVLSLLMLFSALISAAPEYFECRCLYPDEVLDLSGIMAKNPGGSSTILKYRPPVDSFSNLFAETHSVRWRREPSNLYAERFSSELFLSATLRC